MCARQVIQAIQATPATLHRQGLVHRVRGDDGFRGLLPHHLLRVIVDDVAVISRRLALGHGHGRGHILHRIDADALVQFLPIAHGRIHHYEATHDPHHAQYQGPRLGLPSTQMKAFLPGGAGVVVVMIVIANLDRTLALTENGLRLYRAPLLLDIGIQTVLSIDHMYMT